MLAEIKMLIMDYKVPITSIEAVLEDIDVDEDGNVSLRELVRFLKMWVV